MFFVRKIQPNFELWNKTLEHILNITKPERLKARVAYIGCYPTHNVQFRASPNEYFFFQMHSHDSISYLMTVGYFPSEQSRSNANHLCIKVICRVVFCFLYNTLVGSQCKVRCRCEGAVPYTYVVETVYAYYCSI